MTEVKKDWSKGKPGGPFGEGLEKDTGAERDEACNAYYNRKQRPKDNDVGPDVETDFVRRDRDADQEENFKNPDAGPRIPGNWGRFGQ